MSTTTYAHPFPISLLPDDLLFEVMSHLPQRDRVQCLLVNKRWNKLASKLIYRRIYLNDSNVVRSDFMNIAINWTLLYIPSFLDEEESRKIANIKLNKLIQTLQNDQEYLDSIQWIRINWDLDSILQKHILNLLCFKGKSLIRLENVTDPSCNDIIANGTYSKQNLISFDMAPPNSLPELSVPNDYIPNLVKYLNQRISSHLSHMTLFIDPLKLFNYLYPLKEKLNIIDLKLHWRREFFSSDYFINNNNNNNNNNDNIRSRKLFTSLTDVFEVRTLKTLTIISWNESLMSHEIEMINEFQNFIFLEDLSLISIKQDIKVLISLFSKLSNLKRLKMDFLEDYIPETTHTNIFMSILLHCKKLQFIDIRFEDLDSPIIDIEVNKFIIHQKCYCDKCIHVFNNILRKKIFVFPVDYYLTDAQDIAAKDIFKMMRYLSLLPYSKACDNYPSVRTQPMNLDEFVKKMNSNLANYRQHKSQLLKSPRNNILSSSTTNNSTSSSTSSITPDYGIISLISTPRNTSDDNNNNNNNNNNNADIDQLNAFLSSRLTNQRADNLINRLPHEPLTKMDIIHLYHAIIHHFKNTYTTFLQSFPELRFLMLNDIPTVTIEENNERIFHPIFYHYDYTSNLKGWTDQSMQQQSNNFSGKSFKGFRV